MVAGKWDAALDQGILGLYSQGLLGLPPLSGFIKTVLTLSGDIRTV